MKAGNSATQLTLFAEEHRAKPSAWQVSERDSTTQEADSPSPSSECATTSTPSGSSGNMSQASSVPRTTPSVAFWEHCREKAVNSNRQGTSGQTLVVCMAPKGQSLGGASMPNISAWPNDASVCSLSHVLETKEIPQRFYLSSKACAGILRRAEVRGKTLPPMLRDALEAVVKAESPAVGENT